jgi:hypothetical protein
MPDLEAFLRVQIVLLRMWKVVSFVFEGRRGREREEDDLVGFGRCGFVCEHYAITLSCCI